MRWANRLWRDLLPETSLTVTMSDRDGTYIAEVRELPGCTASGDSMETLQKALADAISVHLSEPGHHSRTGVRFWQKIGEVEGDADPHQKIDVLVSPSGK